MVDISDSEEWRPIPGFPFYMASNLGRIRSLARPRPPGRGGTFRDRIIPPQARKWGHCQVFMYRDGVRGIYSAHRIVALAFHGPCPDGLEVNHIDGRPGNNRPENLEYITHRANLLHRTRVLGHGIGESHHQAKLNVDAVKIIRKERAKGVRLRVLAKRFGVSESAISRVYLGRSWFVVGADS